MCGVVLIELLKKLCRIAVSSSVVVVARWSWILFFKVTVIEVCTRRYLHKNVIIFARAQRLGWYGHIEIMQETRNGQSKILVETHFKEVNGKTKDTIGGSC